MNLATMTKTTLAVDLGGTVIKAGRVENGRVVARAQLPGQSEGGAAQALARVAEQLRSLRTDEVAGVAIGLPTLVDAVACRVLVDMKGKYEGLAQTDLRAWAQRELHLPLHLENDAHAALLGEWRFGAGRGCDDLVMITLGTGIGTSVILRGKALRGRHSHAGNLGGHFVIDPHGLDCVCGARGCIEAQQSLRAMQRLAQQDPRFADSVLGKRGQPDFDYAALFAHRDTDALARDMLSRSLDLWGAMVQSLIHAYDPDRVIIGGGILRSRDAIVPHLQSFADRACTPGGAVRIVATELHDDAALLGLHTLFSHPPEYL